MSMKKILPEDHALEIPIPGNHVSRDKYLIRVGVPADGNCYFHSILRASNMDNKFTVREFRRFLASQVDQYYRETDILKSIMDISHVKKELGTNGVWVDERYTDYIGKTLQLKIVMLTNETTQIPGTKICGDQNSELGICIYFLPELSHYEYVCLVHETDGGVHIYSHFDVNRDVMFSNMD